MMDKKNKILNAALKLFVEYGFHGTPTSKIALEAGVSTGTLFHYFKTKNDLVTALYIRTKDSVREYLLNKVEGVEGLKERFGIFFAHSVLWALQYPGEYFFIQQFIFSPHLALISQSVIEEHNRFHLSLFEEGAEKDIFKPYMTDMIASLCGNQINGIYMYLKDKNMTQPEQEKLIDEAFELVWDMISR
jgi:AcrR family transcriptional regulator